MKPASSHTQRVPAKTNRIGSIFPIFLISLVLVSATGAALVRTTLTQRSLVRSEDLRLQADWLVHSASARAAAKLSADAAYKGETWKVSADQLGQANAASIEITVSPINGVRPDLSPEQNRRVDITVNYPPESEQRVRLTRQVFVNVAGE